MRLRLPRWRGGWAIAALALVPLSAGVASARPQLPRDAIADFNPGPWVFFFDPGGARPTRDSRVALARIGEMAERFPAIGLTLCYEDAAGSVSPPAMRRRRLTQVSRAVRQAGIRQVTQGDATACGIGRQGSMPAVVAFPA